MSQLKYIRQLRYAARICMMGDIGNPLGSYFEARGDAPKYSHSRMSGPRAAQRQLNRRIPSPARLWCWRGAIPFKLQLMPAHTFTKQVKRYCAAAEVGARSLKSTGGAAWRARPPPPAARGIGRGAQLAGAGPQMGGPRCHACPGCSTQ